MPRQTLVLDSSQLDTFEECNQKWEFTYLESLTKSNELDEPIAAGSLMHKYLEIYYHTIGCGLRPVEALTKVKQFKPEYDFPLSDKVVQKVYSRFLDYSMKYSTLGDYEIHRRKKYAIKIVEDLPVDSWEWDPMIEQGFSYELLNTSEYLFVLEGRIDFLGETNGTPLWMDHKLQFRARDLYKKSIQFRNYALATGRNLGVIIYIRMHEKIENNTLYRVPISFSTNESNLWKEELIEIYIHIAKEITSGEYRLNRHACAGRFGYPCQFISICEEHGIGIKEAIITRDFVKREEWKPW